MSICLEYNTKSSTVDALKEIWNKYSALRRVYTIALGLFIYLSLISNFDKLFILGFLAIIFVLAGINIIKWPDLIGRKIIWSDKAIKISSMTGEVNIDLANIKQYTFGGITNNNLLYLYLISDKPEQRYIEIPFLFRDRNKIERLMREIYKIDFGGLVIDDSKILLSAPNKVIRYYMYLMYLFLGLLVISVILIYFFDVMFIILFRH